MSEPVTAPAVTILTSLMLLATGIADAGAPFEEEPISYATSRVDDSVLRLQKRIDSGKVRLEFDPRHGYLVSVLRELNVPAQSQALVFSKTSVQRHRITPGKPRAIYFNDDLYFGWVQQGDVLEIASVDPQLGAVFYVLDQRATDQPRFVRQTERCLICHASGNTEGVPGHLVRSVYPARDGMPLFGAGTFRSDHSSPLNERWGGWYVTGTHGRQKHMGNAVAGDQSDPDSIRDSGANVTDLSNRIDTSKYLTPHSDIVALMVLEHQTRMHNLITRANYEARIAIRDAAVVNGMLRKPADHFAQSIKNRFKSSGDRLLKYMLFVDEAQLISRIQGTSGFANIFASDVVRDRKRRSLREFDLEQRLFKYPCSYLIYSDAFDGLPGPVKEHVYRRLWKILTDRDTSVEFTHLSKALRQAILEILLDTKIGLPEYWTSGV